MPTYYRQQGISNRSRRLHKLRFVIFFVLVAALIGLVVLGIDIYKQAKSADTPSQSTTPVTSTISSDSVIQSTPYFQFQTSKKWRAISNESRDGHYVYRQYNGPLVEQEFVVDINKVNQEVLALVQTSRVIAVKLS